MGAFRRTGLGLWAVVCAPLAGSKRAVASRAVRLSLALACLALPGPVGSAQTPVWTARYDSPLEDGQAWTDSGCRNVAADALGNAYVAGQVYTGTSHDYLVSKYDPSGALLWAKTYNGPANSDDYACGLALDGSGNVYVTGRSYQGATGDDYATVKYDASGAQQWVATFNGSGSNYDEARALAVDGSGNVYVTGYSYQGATYFDYATVKYDASGAQQWVATYDGSGNNYDYATALAVDGSGNVYVTGYAYQGGTGTDYTTVKYDAAGAQQWVATYNGSGNDYDYATALAVDGSGNVYVTGYAHQGATYYDYATVKYDAAGTQQWVATYNGSGSSYDEARALAVDGSGNVFVTGRSYQASTGEDYATVKYDAAGAQQWVATYNGSGSNYDQAQALAVDGSGNVYVTGRSYQGATGEDYATVKYDASGAQQWAATYNGSGSNSDYATALAVDGSGNVVVAGNVQEPSDQDLRVVKYSAAGTQLWVAQEPSLSPVNESLTAFAVDGSGNAYAAGSACPVSGSCDYLVVKYDALGSLLWVRRYSGVPGGPDSATALAVDGSGSVYVTGRSYQGATGEDYATVKYDASGAQQWVATYNGSGNNYDYAQALAVDGSGNVYVTGYSYQGATGHDYATVKYDASGAQQWVATYNGSGNNYDYATALAVDGAGNVYVTGYANQGATYYDYATVKYDASGAQQWVATYNGSGSNYDEARALAVDGAGNVYVTGASYQGASYDYATVKYDASGAQQWVATYNGSGNNYDYAQALAVDGAGNVYVTGQSYQGATGYDYATVKYSALGAQQWVSTWDGPASLDEYAMDMKLDAGGSFYVTGYGWNGNGRRDDVTTVGFDSAGAPRWAVRYNGPSSEPDDYGRKLVLGPTGDVYVAGDSRSSTAIYQQDLVVIRYKTNAVDVSLAKTDGTATAVPGQNVTYLITARNDGPADAPGTQIVDTFPASLACTWTCGAAGTTCPVPSGTGNISATLDLPIGSVVVYAAGCLVSPGATGTLSNTATLTAAAQFQDITPADNSATDVDTLVPLADLALTKTDGVATLAPGQNAVYTITGTNAGPSSVSGATVTDSFPADCASVSWTCSGSGGGGCPASGSGNIAASVNLPPGGAVTFTATCAVSPAASGTLVNTATVAAATADPNAGNNGATDTDTLTADADLSAALSDSADPVAMAQAYAYTLTIANGGPSTATGVSAVLSLPAGVGYVSATGAGWSCGEVGGVVTCTRSSFAPGSAPITVNVTAPMTPGLLTATASVSSGTADPTPGNDSDGETTTVSTATPIYVRTDGSDTLCSGTADAGAASAPACAVATVQKGVDNVSPGGQVLVRDGTYLKSNTAVTKPVTIEGQSRAGVVIGPDLQDDHSNSGLGGTVSSAFLVQASDVTLRQLTIDGDANTGLPGSQNFRNGVVTDFRIAGAVYDRTIVENVSFANIYRRGYYLLTRTPGDPAGAYLSTGNVIRDSSFSGVGSVLQHRDASGAIVLLESSALVENNTVTGGANGVLSNYLTTPAVAPLLTARGNSFNVTNTAFNASGLADGSQIGGGGAGQGNTITLAGALSVPEGQNGVGILVQYATGDVLVEGNSVTGTATDAGAWLYQDNFPLQPVVLRGNRFVATSSSSSAAGQGVGVLVTDDPVLFGESGSGPSYATLESNDVLGFVRGVHLWRNGPSGGSAVEATLAFNRIAGNGTGLDNNDATFSVPAENNWWGCSYGPGATGAGCSGTANGVVGNTDTDPWLTLTTSAPAGPVVLPGTYTVTASLRDNSTPAPTGPPYLPAGVPVSFTTSLAGSSYAAPPAVLTDSQALATLGSTALGSTDACAAVDAQTSCVNRAFMHVTDLQVTKSDGSASAVPGQNVAYTVVFSNTGLHAAPGTGLVDTVATPLTGCTWTCAEAGAAVCPSASGSGSIAELADLPASSSLTYVLTCAVAPSATGTLTNTASLTPGPYVLDTNAANDSTTDTDTLIPQADLSLVKTDSADPVNAGAAFSYTLAASNAGPSTAQSLTVTDTLPAGVGFVSASGTGWSCGEAGGTVTCTRASLATGAAPDITIAVTAPNAPTSLSNTASVSATTADPAAANNSDSEGTSVDALADLSITKDDGLGTATPGQSTTYTIVASNAGPSDVATATVADTFPAECGSASWSCVGAGGGTCTASGSGSINDSVSLPSGASVTYAATCTLSASATGTLANTATVTSGVNDPSAANNSATDSDTLAPSADLSITATDDLDPVGVHRDLTYTLTVTNAGPSDASGVTLTDTLPAGTSFVSSIPGGPACSHAAGTLTCDLGVLAASGDTTVTVVVQTTAPGSLSNTAGVSAATSDPAPGNDSATETTQVQFEKGDLDNDLHTDLYLANTVTGEHRVWEMAGVVQTADLAFNPSTPASPSQRVAGVDDFDGDWRNDLVLWDSATGAVEFWLMNGVDRQGAPVPISGAPTLATNWKLSATADFDADGQPDIVWRNFSSQKIVIWTMNGTAKAGSIIPTPDQAVDFNWEIVGAFDLNGDGTTDFLWYNWSSGKIVYWLMDASVVRVTGSFTSPANAGDANWKVLAAGDYGVGPGGVAGTKDIVWRNADSGRYVVWYLDHAGVRTSGTFTSPNQPAVNPTDWTVVGPR